ncbi:hypothetical protein JCM11641_006899 [Rhodosporidiobolus odoratus]
MLDRLPLELVQHVVQLSLPSETSPVTYRPRQDTLVALCETKKALGSIAKPLLYEVIRIRSSAVLAKLVKSLDATALGVHTRAIYISGLEERDRVFQQQRTELNVLGRFKALLRLVLSHVSLEVEWSRILAGCCHVRYNPYAWHGTIDSERHADVFALVDDIMDLEDRIKEGEVPHLSTLILPSALRHAQIPCDDMDVLQTLLTTCTSHQVEVIFEDLPHPYYDSFISPAFSRRCEELGKA